MLYADSQGRSHQVLFGNSRANALVIRNEVGQEFVKAGSPANSFFQPAAAAIKAVRNWSANGSAVFPWCVGAYIYYMVFYRTRLIPRWLSVWGLLGLTMFLVSAFAVMFGFIDSFSTTQMVLSLPIMVQEIVLAVWLIVKGYRE